MEDAGAFAEVTKFDEMPIVERSGEELAPKPAGRIRKIGQSTGRSAAASELLETIELGESYNAPYALSMHATRFLESVLPDANTSERLFRPSDVAHIVEALLLARGPVQRRGSTNLDYRRGLEALMSQDSSFTKVAEDVFGNTANATYVSFAQFAKKCRTALKDDATVEDLIHLSDASYEVEYIEKPAEMLRAERRNNLGRQGVVRSTKHRGGASAPVVPDVHVAPATPAARVTQATVPDNWFSEPRRAEQGVIKTGANNQYRYPDNQIPTPRATEDDDPLAWQRDALCSQTDPEAFFPEKGGSTRDAKRVCISCDVRDQCLQYALENDERFGIWGGKSERERRKLKRQVA